MVASCCLAADESFRGEYSSLHISHSSHCTMRDTLRTCWTLATKGRDLVLLGRLAKEGRWHSVRACSDHPKKEWDQECGEFLKILLVGDGEACKWYNYFHHTFLHKMNSAFVGSSGLGILWVKGEKLMMLCDTSLVSCQLNEDCSRCLPYLADLQQERPENACLWG